MAGVRSQGSGVRNHGARVVAGASALQRNADRAPSTTSSSPPTELAANPLGGELFERKSRQATDLMFGQKLAAK